MKIFIDTANVEEIREVAELGILSGVTTNPSLIAKEGRNFEDVVREITQIVDGPNKVICQMVEHPLTKAGIEKFNEDWKNVK